MPNLIDPNAIVGETILPPGVLFVLLRRWYPHRPPVPIQVGEIDIEGTLQDRIYALYKQVDPPANLWIDLVAVIGGSASDVVQLQGEVYRERYLANAVGDQLDAIGELVDLRRYSLDDDLYRKALRARGATVVRRRNVDSLLEVARLVFPAATEISYTPSYPAGFCLAIEGVDAAELQTIAEVLSGMRPLGVDGCLVALQVDAPGMDSTTGPEVYTSSWDSTTGGAIVADPMWISSSAIP